MKREELEKKYVDLVYAQATSDYSRMADFVWDTLNDNAEEMDDDTLLDLITHYTDEDEDEEIQ